MKRYREERTGSQITIWNDEKGIGIRFQENESLQAYSYELILKEPSKYLSSEEGMKALNEVTEELEKYAKGEYTEEFKELETRLFFIKEFGDSDYSIGILTGEPNEDGEQDYEGFSVTKEHLCRLEDGEDFLCDYEGEVLKGNTDHLYGNVKPTSAKKYTQIETLFKETEEALILLGYPEKHRGNLSLETLDWIDEDNDESEVREKARGILENAIDEAFNIIESR